MDGLKASLPTTPAAQGTGPPPQHRPAYVRVPPDPDRLPELRQDAGV